MTETTKDGYPEVHGNSARLENLGLNERPEMSTFFKEWWDSGREDPEEFASLVQQYADIVRTLEREACAVAAWTAGMAAYSKARGMPCDAREVGSAVAEAIRMRSSVEHGA